VRKTREDDQEMRTTKRKGRENQEILSDL